MKKLLLIFFILSSFLFAQNDFVNSSFHYSYNYFGFPFSVDLGYAYKKNSHFVYVPRVGISFDYGAESSFGIFANLGMEYRYRRFFIDLNYKQGITPPFATFNYKNLEYYGQLRLCYSFDNVSIYYAMNIGKMIASEREVYRLSSIFKINQNIGLSSTFIDDGVNKLKFNAGFGASIIPNEKQYSYNVSFSMPYSFFHYWGELGIMPYIGYSAYFDKSEKKYSIGFKYLYSIMMMPLSNLEAHLKNMDFLTFVHLEYKLFMRFLPSGFNDIYLVAFGNIGYGKYFENSINKGNLLYVVGGGIGYNLYGSTPLQLTFGVDNNNSLVMNLIISTIVF
ncbi:hypothetical protein [Brachyspira pilosicoli]|uniref:Uncharacterized protein n=1 Tax=Brachyspira pilosicoli TaxID=52584 RepID=A0A5C8ER58_BRAPL|nr:hypothetical protein [Brachyspira pilosicoli]TXJ39441.1 hypothetical protein EPJ72_09880 [Brachyspira pilosicoli]